MAQSKIVNRNDGFVNPPPLPFSCEISVALHLAEPGLTAGRQTKVSQFTEFLKLYNSTSRANLMHLNTFLGLIALYQ